MPFSSPKIVIVGAGGVTFPLTLTADILSFPDLRDSVISLYDIEETRLNRTAGLVKKLISAHNLPTRVEVTTDMTTALNGARYIIITFQVGGLDAYKIDKDASAKYGIDLCVGDTLNAGGVFRGLRSLGALQAIAERMKELCPTALVLNYANPMAINCWGLNELGIRTVGLCHSVQGTTMMLASLIGADYKDVDFKCYGINHQAWITEFRDRGVDAYPRLREALNQKFPSPSVQSTHGEVVRGGSEELAVDHDADVYHYEKVRTEIFRTFGVFQTESSHHAGEYVPWFRKNKTLIDAYIKTRWDYYECGINFDMDAQVERMEKRCHEPLTASLEYGAGIINAMETNVPYVMYGNVPNYGAPGADAATGAHLIPNLPRNACVEVACLVDRNGVQPTAPGPLPPGLAAINRTNINVQELTVLAHQTGDPNLVEQAVAMDPLTGALLTLPEIRSLTREMLEQQSQWLPQFRKRS
ncbi:alpha-glucosidase/alpha-galactosidase [Verrucomicrobia bacterium LW23]|nr:alpha-glucosidase/alpha-galactosidase [Verrucomicrobia bacterium LW23]